ncbi:MAG: nitrilase-related carbon-nitrogen hydrolase [Mariniblastus sp.]
MNQSPQKTSPKKPSRWHVTLQAWLLYIAAVFVGSIATTIPLAVWVGPILILLFLDQMPRLIGFVLFMLFAISVFVISQKGVIPVPDTEFYFMAVIIGLLGYFTYWLQVASKDRLPRFLVPLVLPCASVALEYGASAGAFGSWGATGYSQAGNLTLMQLASITGVSGITFFMCWTTSTVWWLVSSVKLSDKKIPAEAITYFVFAIAIIAFGQYRIAIGKALLSQPADGRQVACVIAPKGTYTPEIVFRWLDAARSEQSDAESGTATSNETQTLLDESRPVVFAELEYLLRKSVERATAGAKLIVWSEAALSTPPEFESEILDRCSEFAKKYSTNLAMTLGVLRPKTDAGKFIENKTVFINEEGGVLGEYFKTKTVPGEPSLNGDGMIPTFETKFVGRVSPIVCFDADFPNFVSQIGQTKTENTGPHTIVISANDWEECAGQHMQMSAFRAIENGMWVVRSTSRGTSAVISPLGEVQERLSSFECAEPAMSGWISGNRLQTWYPMIGDLLAQASCVGFLLLILMAIFGSKRSNHESDQPGHIENGN